MKWMWIWVWRRIQPSSVLRSSIWRDIVRFLGLLLFRYGRKNNERWRCESRMYRLFSRVQLWSRMPTNDWTRRWRTLFYKNNPSVPQRWNSLSIQMINYFIKWTDIRASKIQMYWSTILSLTPFSKISCLISISPEINSRNSTRLIIPTDKVAYKQYNHPGVSLLHARENSFSICTLIRMQIISKNLPFLFHQ